MTLGNSWNLLKWWSPECYIQVGWFLLTVLESESESLNHKVALSNEAYVCGISRSLGGDGQVMMYDLCITSLLMAGSFSLFIYFYFPTVAFTYDLQMTDSNVCYYEFTEFTPILSPLLWRFLLSASIFLFLFSPVAFFKYICDNSCTQLLKGFKSQLYVGTWFSSQ